MDNVTNEYHAAVVKKVERILSGIEHGMGFSIYIDSRKRDEVATITYNVTEAILPQEITIHADR